MEVYRLCRDKYSDKLNGLGAAKSNNRWNSRGTEIIYTAESRALALAEVAVHLSVALIPKDFVMMRIFIPDDVKMQTVAVSSLDRNWNSFPPLRSTQKIGDSFVMAQEYLILKVPSAVVSGDFNYLINPGQKEFNQIKIAEVVEFPLDYRLFR